MYQQMMEVQDKHWWFVARRLIVEQVIKKLNLPKDAEIFEAGCGTGANKTSFFIINVDTYYLSYVKLLVLLVIKFISLVILILSYFL